MVGAADHCWPSLNGMPHYARGKWRASYWLSLGKNWQPWYHAVIDLTIINSYSEGSPVRRHTV